MFDRTRKRVQKRAKITTHGMKRKMVLLTSKNQKRMSLKRMSWMKTIGCWMCAVVVVVVAAEQSRAKAVVDANPPLHASANLCCGRKQML